MTHFARGDFQQKQEGPQTADSFQMNSFTGLLDSKMVLPVPSLFQSITRRINLAGCLTNNAVFKHCMQSHAIYT